MKRELDLTAIAEQFGIYYTVRETRALCLDGRYAVENKHIGIVTHVTSRNQAVRYMRYMVTALERIAREQPGTSEATKITYATWYATRKFSPHLYDRPRAVTTIQQRLEWSRDRKSREAAAETLSFGCEE